MRVLIATWVIIDALSDRKPWAEDAQKLIRLSLERKIDGCLSAKSVADIHYLIKSYLHNEGKTREKMALLFSAVSVLDTKGLDCTLALSSPTLDYEGAIQIETALKNSCSYILTRNLKDFVYSPIKAVDPKTFLEAQGF